MNIYSPAPIHYPLLTSHGDEAIRHVVHIPDKSLPYMWFCPHFTFPITASIKHVDPTTLTRLIYTSRLWRSELF